MDLAIFKLEDYASYLNGDTEYVDNAQYLTNLTRGEYDFLVALVDSTEDYDWR